MADVPNPTPGSNQPPPPPPPPPPPGSAPPPYGGARPGGFAQQPSPAGYGAPVNTAPRAPRPRAPVAACLMIAGAVIALVGSFLPWVGTNRLSTNGFDRYFWERSSSSFDLENPAIVVVIGSIIMLVLGMATLAAGRVLAITIIGIVFAVLGIVVGAGLLALMVDFADFVNIDLKIGIILQPIAPTISLIGAILATAKKRPPVSY